MIGNQTDKLDGDVSGKIDFKFLEYLILQILQMKKKPFTLGKKCQLSKKLLRKQKLVSKIFKIRAIRNL